MPENDRNNEDFVDLEQTTDTINPVDIEEPVFHNLTAPEVRINYQYQPIQYIDPNPLDGYAAYTVGRRTAPRRGVEFEMSNPNDSKLKQIKFTLSEEAANLLEKRIKNNLTSVPTYITNLVKQNNRKVSLSYLKIEKVHKNSYFGPKSQNYEIDLTMAVKRILTKNAKRSELNVSDYLEALIRGY